MIDKVGNSVVVQTKDGNIYKRNSSFVKSFEERPVDQSTVNVDVIVNGNVSECLDNDETSVYELPIKDVHSRPSRSVQKPARFKDYVLFV